jgi:hypothetical protein
VLSASNASRRISTAMAMHPCCLRSAQCCRCPHPGELALRVKTAHPESVDADSQRLANGGQVTNISGWSALDGWARHWRNAKQCTAEYVANQCGTDLSTASVVSTQGLSSHNRGSRLTREPTILRRLHKQARDGLLTSAAVLPTAAYGDPQHWHSRMAGHHAPHHLERSTPRPSVSHSNRVRKDT